MSQEFKLKNIGEKRNYFLKEIAQNESKSKNHKKIRTTLNYIEHVLVLISAFASLLGIPLGNTSSAIELKLLCNSCGN